MAALTLSEKLDQLGTRYDELTQELSSAEIVSDSARFQKVAKQQSELGEIVAKHREFKQIEKDLAGAHQMFLEAEDAEMKQMAHDEEKELTARKETVERELKLLLLPKDPLDEKSVIVEIRAGTGGDEAALFAAELFRMYSRYAETQGWKVEILESSPSSIGGLKEVVAAIQGQKVYSKLKYESGVHRVQRVPATETQGRIHTSAATVAVLPEATKSTSRSKQRICASTRSALPAPAASLSTPPIPPCASRIFPADWLFPNRTKNPKSRIAPKPCAFSARGSTNRSRRSAKPPSPPSAVDKSKLATAPKKSDRKSTRLNSSH